MINMSKYRNCMNCGAAIDAEANKCPYCGTSYLDICGLKLDGRTPIVLKFGTEYKGHKAIISALVVAEANCSMTTTYDTFDVYNDNKYIDHFRSSYSTDIELHFRTIPDTKGQIATFEIED